eukprot:UN10875
MCSIPSTHRWSRSRRRSPSHRAPSSLRKGFAIRRRPARPAMWSAMTDASRQDAQRSFAFRCSASLPRSTPAEWDRPRGRCAGLFQRRIMCEHALGSA